MWSEPFCLLCLLCLVSLVPVIITKTCVYELHEIKHCLLCVRYVQLTAITYSIAVLLESTDLVSFENACEYFAVKLLLVWARFISWTVLDI